MKKIILFILLLLMFSVPVGAEELIAPEAPEDLLDMMPENQESFGQGIWYVIQSGLADIRPDITESLEVCLRVFAAVLLLSLLRTMQGESKLVLELVGVVGVACILLEPAHSLIHLGADTVHQISEYGKLLLPVMTAALAAQGGATTSAALYAGTALFDTLLSTAISSVLIPMVYVFLALSVVNAATGEALVKRLMDFSKWLMTWCLKIVLYVFTGYISITGVVSGVTDQTALKTAKLAISGVVPVVGNILSDASEAVLVGAGVLKNAAGIYGMLAVLAIFIGPFLKIGVQYVLLKLTAAACGAVAEKKTGELIDSFSGAMGFLLAMTGAICLMQLISAVCFLKGME